MMAVSWVEVIAVGIGLAVAFNVVTWAVRDFLDRREQDRAAIDEPRVP